MTALEQVYRAATQLIDANPVLRDFSPWPHQPAVAHRVPAPVPAVSLVRAFCAAAAPSMPRAQRALMAAVAAAADELEWRRTYTEAEVGADFMQRYGYVELLGPNGHFIDHTTRAYVGYWGEGLYYPWHAHQAEELYFVVAGAAEFAIEGERHLRGVGDTQLHTANQPHAMRTAADGPGILTFVLWRGEGLEGLAAMTPGAT